MEVISCKRSLSQPPSNNKESIFDQGRCVTVPAHWLHSKRLLIFEPLVFLCVEYPQRRVILLAIIATKHVQLLVVKGGSVVLDLGRVLLLGGCWLLLLTTRLQLLYCRLRLVFWYQFPGEARLMGQISLGFVLVIA